MMFPPPNITGTLHLGHALTGAIQDALVRQKRMQGHRCLFVPGFDHAGLATQTVVESILWKRDGLTRQQIGKEKFLQMAHEWKDNKRSEMRNQLDRLGLDLNHEKEYFTLDENSSLAVKAAFKKLFHSGDIYRSTKEIFWSEKLNTTLSDIEVERVDGADRYIRTGEIVERRPIAQWFIRAERMAKAAVDVVKNGSIEIIPKGYENTWHSWLVGNGVQDWCISRQSWWGHTIPAYRLESSGDSQDTKWVVADNLEEARLLFGPSRNESEEVIQDSDVLDTWFSSSLLPLTISGWPNEEKFSSACHDGKFPLHIMETGFDILTFWVSKMVMISLGLTGTIPFQKVLLHGMICDGEGKKMSKSRGNVIDPLDVINGARLEELQGKTRKSHADGLLDDQKLQSILENQKRIYPKGIPLCGADGLRAYLLSHDVLEEIVKIQVGQIDKIRRLSNKIWNIFRFLLLLREGDQTENALRDLRFSEIKLDKDDGDHFDELDIKLLRALRERVQNCDEVFNETYHFHYAINQLESFMIVNLSHDYIEKVKDVLLAKEGDHHERSRRFRVLSFSLLTSLKLMHPFMPHLTEFLYQKMVYDETTDWGRDLQDGIDPNRLLSYQLFPKLSDIPSL